MTITEQKAFLEGYKGLTPAGEGSAEALGAFLSDCRPEVSAEIVALGNPQGIYEALTVRGGGRTVKARSIRPAAAGKQPLVLLFHDLNRGVRGWHHMTRFLALGYGVVALEAAPFREDWTKQPEAADFPGRYRDALLLAKAALALPWVDADHVVTCGEGFGGGLAILTAALLPGALRCAAINPLPGDFRGLGIDNMDDVDLTRFAPLCRGKTLMGTCLMDTYAPPKGQAAIYNHLKCEKKWKIYPKYIHERVNFFENEFVAFLLERITK